MNSFATLGDKVTERRNARSLHAGEGGDHGIPFNLALGHNRYALRYDDEPDVGIVRSVKNGAVIHAVVSVFVPVYGLIYFFAAKQPRGN